MGRVAEAWRTLLGRTDAQKRVHHTLTRIELEWMEIQSNILEVMRTLDLSSDRLRKQAERRERAAAKVQREPPAPRTEAAAPPPQLHGRDLVKWELAQRHGGRILTPVELAKKNGDD